MALSVVDIPADVISKAVNTRIDLKLVTLDFGPQVSYGTLLLKSLVYSIDIFY